MAVPAEERRGKFGEVVEGALEFRRPGDGVRRSVSGISSSPKTSAESCSPSDPISVSLSKGSSLSTFIAAATQRSAMLVTAFSFAMSSLCAKLRSRVAESRIPSTLLPRRLRIELAMLPLRTLKFAVALLASLFR